MPASHSKISATYHPSNRATLRCADSKQFLRSLPDKCAQLVLTSPPYNIGKEYEQERSVEDYIDEQRQVIKEAIRITRPGGSICWQVGHYVNGHAQIIPIDILLYPVFAEFENDGPLYLRNRVVWHFEHGQHCQLRFSGRHEMILWFTKGDDYYFDLDAVRVPQKYPGKRAYQGPRKGDYSGNPKGKNPGDVWSFPNVKQNHIEKTCHPCQFPIELADRFIEALSQKDDLIVDPYVGVGSTVAAAILRGRRGAGCDVYRPYVEIARQRASKATKGTLKFRPRTQAVYVPKPNTSLTTVPATFRYNGCYDSQAKNSEAATTHQ